MVEVKGLGLWPVVNGSILIWAQSPFPAEDTGSNKGPGWVLEEVEITPDLIFYPHHHAEHQVIADLTPVQEVPETLADPVLTYLYQKREEGRRGGNNYLFCLIP